MTPTKYVLLEEHGSLYLRAYAPELLRGYANIEAVRRVTGKSLPKLRKQGAALAKRWGVPFEDKTQ
jgi:hypothetical protein